MLKNNTEYSFINEKIPRLKKYLFLISIILFVTSISHLIYIYINNDSKLFPIKGGTISEGLIGNFPSLNPIKQLSGNNKYIVNLLYRSLLKYDIKDRKLVSDLASCDISNLLYIECYIKDNIKWSDGTNVTKEDIISTYKIIQNTNINPIMYSLLLDTLIGTKDNNIITFKNTKKDINFLNVFLQPIISKKTIDELGKDNLEGNFSTSNQIYSGDFKITNVSSDQTIGITKLVLEKNTYNNNEEIFIDKFIIKFFPDTNSFLKNKDTINIFNDNNTLIGDSIPRFKNYEYTIPQYVSLFLNQNNIKDIDLRNFILNIINRDNLIQLLGKDNYKEVINPYLGNIIIEEKPINKNFENIISKLGYYKKSKLIENILSNKNKETNLITGSTINTGSISNTVSTISTGSINEDLSNFNFQEKSKTIIDPSFIDKYNFLSKDNILLKGIPDPKIQNVYVNDYKLKSFKKGDSEFYYRIKESIQNIKDGINTYKIYFEKNGNKELKEEIVILYNKDKNKLEEEKAKFIKNLYLEKNIKTSEIKKEEDKNNNNIVNNNSQENDIKKIAEYNKKLQKLNELDELSFYNEKLEKFTLKLYYIATEKDLEITAIYIKNSLEKIGIKIDLTPIPISELSKVLLNKNDYDIIVGGVNLGYFDFNIFPYFHSSQAKNGYNFSNIRKTSLDIILEELKGNLITKDEFKNLEKKVLDILITEQIVKTLYTPKIKLLVDKNIKNSSIPYLIPNKSLRSSILNNSYINENKVLNLENKGGLDFIKFLLKKLQGATY